MIGSALDGSEVRRWVVSAGVALGLHAAAATVLFTSRDLVAVGQPTDAVIIYLAPLAAPPSDTIEELPAGPKQEQAEAPPPPPNQEKIEQSFEEKVDVPPAPAPPVVVVPPPKQVTQKLPEPTPALAAPAATAPPRAHDLRSQINTWYSKIVTQLEGHKAYPRAARERGETGIVQLAFSIDREGQVVSSMIVKSSGYAALDQETMATVRRAQPFPAPPSDVDGAKFDFTVPVKFNIR